MDLLFQWILLENCILHVVLFITLYISYLKSFANHSSKINFFIFYIFDKITIAFSYKVRPVSGCFYQSVRTIKNAVHRKIYYVKSQRYITRGWNITRQSVAELESISHRGTDRRIRKRKQQMFARTNNVRLVGAWYECDRARSSVTMISHRRTSNIYRMAKWPLWGTYREPKRGDAPLLYTRLWVPFDADQLSLPGYISSFESLHPDTARRNEDLCFPWSVFPVSLPLFIFFFFLLYVHPRRRVKLQILHPFARANTSRPRPS